MHLLRAPFKSTCSNRIAKETDEKGQTTLNESFPGFIGINKQFRVLMKIYCSPEFIKLFFICFCLGESLLLISCVVRLMRMICMCKVRERDNCLEFALRIVSAHKHIENRFVFGRWKETEFAVHMIAL